jgi:hypothetical protein
VVIKSGRRAKVQGIGVIRLPWARQINSAFTNSFYSNHVRGRPSVAVSAPILLYIAWVTCLSTKQTDRLQKAAGSGDCQLCQVAERCCLSYFRCRQLPHAGGHSFEEAHVASTGRSGERPPIWSRLRRLVGPARRLHTCRACSFSELANWIETEATDSLACDATAIEGPLFWLMVK